jgi:hypothetical protein
VAVWGEDEPPRVWDIATGKLSAPLDEPGPRSVSFSPDGKNLLRAGGSFAPVIPKPQPAGIRLSEWRTGKRLAPPPTPDKGGMWFAGHTPDGSRLLLAGKDRLRVHDSRTFRVLHDCSCKYLFNAGRISAISADGRFVAFRGSPHWTIYEVATGQQVRTLSHKGGSVTAVHFHPDGRRAVSTATDGTGLVWELSAPPKMPALPGPGDAAGWRKCWKELGADAAVADRWAWALAWQPKEAVRFLTSHLKPVPKRDRARIAPLIRQLGSDDMKERDAASKALTKIGELARPELSEATKSPDAEVKRRAVRLLAALGPEPADPPETPETRAARRAALVLERIATPEAKRLLAALAAGEPLAATTREAAAAFMRLRARR